MPVIEKTAPPETGINLPAKPSRFRVAGSLVLGYMAAFLFLIPAALLAEGAGIDVWDEAQTNAHGLFYRFDFWSVLAEACAGVFVAAMTAFWARRVLLARTGWEVSFGFTFLTAFLTGYAPAAALTPLYGATWLASLIVATLILHWRMEPAGAEPMAVFAAVPRRYRHAAKIALAVAVPAMGLYALAYGTTHPLRTSGTIKFGGNGNLPSESASTNDEADYRRNPGTVNDYRLQVQNHGPFAVTDLEVVAIDGSAVFQLEGVAMEPDLGSPAAAEPSTIEAGQRVDMGLRLRQGPVCSEPLAQLDAIQVRYETVGRQFTARLPLADPPTIFCAAAR